jgi:hypothetical protein
MILPPMSRSCLMPVVRRVDVAPDAKTQHACFMYSRMPIGLCAGLAAMPAPVYSRRHRIARRKLWKTSSGPTQPECARINTGYSII